jgi:hypothetical protein
MGVITGLNMTVNGENTLRMWQIEELSELTPYVASNTDSGTGRKCGIDDWKGIYLGYGHTPAVFPGDFFTFAASMDGALGWYSEENGAYCEQIDIVLDVEKNQYIQYAVHFSRNGTLTKGAAVYSDTTVPSPPCPESLTVIRGEVDENDVRFAHLIMRCPGRPYVSSSTSGGRKRNRGAFDAALEYHRYFSDPTTLPAVETDYRMQLEVTDATNWDLEWMKMVRLEAIVNTETQENVGVKLFFEFNGQNGTATGSVKNPALTEKWPFS